MAMSGDSGMAYTESLFAKAVDSDEGDVRQQFLKQAKNVLELVPDDYPGKTELLSQINYMLY